MSFNLSCKLYQSSDTNTKKTNWYSKTQYIWKNSDLEKLNIALNDATSRDAYANYKNAVAECKKSDLVASKFHEYFKQAINFYS